MHRATDPDPLRAADPTDRSRRDTMPAGMVFLVMVGVLAVAALLNAEAMLHRAETSELGTGRDVALAFWQPVESASRSLGLGLPRSGVEALRGTDPNAPSLTAARGGGSRGRLGHEPYVPAPAGPVASASGSEAAAGPSGGETQPTIATPLGLPPPRTTQTTTAPGPPTLAPGPATTTTAPSAPAGSGLRRPTVDDPLRMLVIGDSTMDAVGSSLLRELTETGLVEARLDFRISTGLSRPDFFDWPAHLRDVRAEEQPEVVVIMIGANDAQPFIIDDAPESHGTDLWFATYRQRVASLLDELTADGGWVLWIGQPVMRSPDYDGRMQQLNQIYQDEISRYTRAVYLDPRPILSDEGGGYSAYLVDGNGDRELVRQADGVHLTPAGGDRLTPLIIDELNEITPLY